MKKANWLITALRYFSLYESPFEKKVDGFLKKVKRKKKSDLELLMQQDLVRLTIFFEYKFKGYKKLKKSYRRKIYEHAHQIRADFKGFYAVNHERISKKKLGMNLDKSLESDPHFDYLLVIMEYLKPGRLMQYKESATFEKLLRDPKKDKLVGDCNQLVTMYIYLFSLRSPIKELQIKILPKHVCLHYKGQDIEATNGSLAQYDDYTFISGVTEIIPTNLLDVSDPDEKQFKISPKNMLKSAEFAYHFSSHRQTVEKNLFIAYHNLAIYYAKRKSYKQASLYAYKSGNTRLQRDVTRMEAVSLLKSNKYNKALLKFKKIGDLAGEKASYQNELSALLGKNKGLKTVKDFKKVKSRLKRIKELAFKLGEQKIVTFVNDLYRKF